MGQKVNPVGFRICVTKNWKHSWNDDSNRSDSLIDSLELYDLIRKNYAHCAVADVNTSHRENSIDITIKTARPAMIIGRKGSDIEKVKDLVHGHLKKAGKDKKISIKVVEIEKPELSAELVGQSVAKQIEGRGSFRKAMKKAIQSTMRSGAKGIKITCGGRLSGAEIARSETYKEGSTPLHTLKNDIDYASVQAHTTYGVIGVKVWICK